MRTEDYVVFDIEVQGQTAFATLPGNDQFHRYPADELYKELVRLAGDLRESEEVRVLVVTGSNDIFSLGNEPVTSETYGDHLGSDLARNTARRYLREFLDLDTVVITALNGPVIGGILAFVLTSDIIVAEEHATFRDVHVNVGTPSCTGPFFWPMSVGLMKAKRYLLTGDRISAREAESIGLVTEVVPTGEALARATEYAEQLLKLSPAAVGGTKRALNQWMKQAFPAIFDAGLGIQFLAMTGPDFSHEGMEQIQEEELGHLRNT